jgi:hypothetical protein
MQLTKLTRPIEAVAANVPNSVNASNAAWADMTNAKESNNGKFDFCQTMTSSSLVSFPLFTFCQSPSQNIVKPFAEMKEYFGIMRCNNQLECLKIDLSMLCSLQIW